MQQAMLRITVTESGGPVSILLEGRLSGPWVEELRRIHAETIQAKPGRPVTVYLGGMVSASSQGRILLADLKRQGTRLEAGSDLIAALVEEP